MKSRTGYLALGVSAALVLAGVLLEGTEQNPWNLAVSYFLPIGTVEALMARRTWWSYTLCVLVSGLAIYGAVWTLGAKHAVSPRAALVYTGLMGAVMSSAMIPLWAARTGGTAQPGYRA